jgi:hypothetical protein
MPACDAELFEALRVERHRMAEKQSVPTFVVFSDRTLAEIAARLPETHAALLAVSGVEVVLDQDGHAMERAAQGSAWSRASRLRGGLRGLCRGLLLLAASLSLSIGLLLAAGLPLPLGLLLAVVFLVPARLVLAAGGAGQHPAEFRAEAG